MNNLKFIILTLISTIMSESIKEPEYNLLYKENSIEIRDYPKYVIAKISVSKLSESDNSMFRTLAGYIFGGNKANQSIPMTAPVITRENNNYSEMIFFMLDAKDISNLPIPNDTNVKLDMIEIGTTISIKFGMWATDSRVSYYKDILDKYIKDNDIQVISSLMIAQYNSPWTLPPFRKNELLYKIKYESK